MHLMETLWHLTLKFCLLGMFYRITDALVPSCNDESEDCRCHPSYSKYYDKLQGNQNLTDNCLKVFNNKLNWNLAYKTCESEYSFILQNLKKDVLYQDLKDKGVKLIWIGMKRISGFYVNVGSNEPSIFKESNRDWGKKWSLGEPVHDCVALNLSSELLVTVDCTTELEFVCQNSGLPKYPINGSLACPDDWLLFYQLPFSRKKCLQIFKSNSQPEANQTCLSAGSELADLALHLYMNKFADDSRRTTTEDGKASSTPKPSFFFQFGAPNLWDKNGPNPVRNNSESCDSSNILSILGPEVSRNLNFNCSDKLFICEQKTSNISLSVRVTPPIRDAFPTSDSTLSLLTCEVLKDGRDIDGMRKNVLYQWFKNGIPISVGSHLVQVGFYSDPTKFYPLKANKQGTYRCAAKVAGLMETHLSEEVDYFYSDLSTFIFSEQSDDAKLNLQDFSQIGFRNLKATLKRSMAILNKNAKPHFPNFRWDFQNFSVNGNVSTIKLLLYVKRNESRYVEVGSEREVHKLLNMYVKQKQFLSSVWIQNPLSLRSADACYSEVIPGSVTSYDGDLVWNDSLQTKTAISEPMCLNGWKLVTRECKPSIVTGAEWQPFNYTACSKYQTSVEGLKTNCPDGFRKLKSNLCYSLNNEGHTYDEANEICSNSSSYLMNLRIFSSFTELGIY